MYGQPKQTIEPAFGIIKSTPEFWQFILRGKAMSGLKWKLVTLSYNVNCLFHIQAQLVRVPDWAKSCSKKQPERLPQKLLCLLGLC